MTITWDEWRGSEDGRPSMLIKRIFEWRGYRLDLHKFVRGDDPGCFHTHPAMAFRFVLWGGYIEDIRKLAGWPVINGIRGDPVYITTKRTLRPGYIGRVRPEFCHRIDALRNGRCSYSLWFRMPKTADVKIVGSC